MIEYEVLQDAKYRCLFCTWKVDFSVLDVEGHLHRVNFAHKHNWRLNLMQAEEYLLNCADVLLVDCVGA
jgi:hypothetical protein